MASVQASPPKLNPEQILEQMGQLALSDLEQVMNKGYYLLAEKKSAAFVEAGNGVVYHNQSGLF